MNEKTINRIANGCGALYDDATNAYSFSPNDLVNFANKIEDMSIIIYKFDQLLAELIEPWPDIDSDTKLIDHITCQNPEMVKELKRLLFNN